MKVIQSVSLGSGDIIIMSDVDEIPRKEVVQLYRYLWTVVEEYDS